MPRPAWIFVLSMAASCVATVEDGGSPEAPEHVDVPGAAPAGATAGTAMTGAGPAAAGGEPIAASPMRRLNRYELANTVRDLLGVARVALPPMVDDTVGGFAVNGTLAVSGQQVQQYWEVAADLAAAAPITAAFLGCDPRADEGACFATFVASFGRRAYRRPLAADELADLGAVYAAVKPLGTFEDAVRTALRAMLQSPSFLYRPVIGVPEARDPSRRSLTGYEVASRLSYLLWATMPDATLMDAAERGQLASSDGVLAQARRLVGDRRFLDTVAAFDDQWLSLGRAATAAKDTTLYKAWSPAVAQAAAVETERFVEYVLLQRGGDIGELLTASYSFPTGTASLYGVTAPASASTTPTDLPATQRRGVLTQISLLAMGATEQATHPIARGRLVRERFLCHAIPNPPPDLMPQPIAPDATSTTRQQYERSTADPFCGTCHRLMNPLGFMFESYDAVGRYRTTENGRPIDAAGEVIASDLDGTYAGAVALTTALARSAQVRECLLANWFHYALGREREPADEAFFAAMSSRLAASPKLMDAILALVTSTAFRFQKLD